MKTKVLMPALSPTMSEGKLTKWLVKEGDKIKAGDLLAEIETDKAIMEFESSEDGTLVKILIPEGENAISVNEPIAILENNVRTAEQKNVPESKAVSEDSVEDGSPPATNQTKELITDQVSSKPKPETTVTENRLLTYQIKVSPLAKKMAAELNFDLGEIDGSGPAGRIIKADVEKHKEKMGGSGAGTDSKISGKVVTGTNAELADKIALTPMRRTIAERLTQAKRDIPHFYLRKKARVDKLLAARAILNKKLHKKNIKISLNDMIIKAVGQALIDNPDCNVTWGGDCIIREKVSDIAIAVAIQDGLLTPVIRNVEKRSLSSISLETKKLIKRSKERKLTPAEFSGGTITISNLGMMGIDSFDAVINPPHGSILAVGATEILPIFDEEDKISKATVMNLTLSVDHRTIDGATGAYFLNSVVSFLEEPITLLT